MSTATKLDSALLRIVVRVLALDLLLFVASLVGWASVRTIDGPALAGATILRVIATQAYLWHLLGPVRRWRGAGVDADDSTLLAADQTLQSGLGRFVIAYAIGWALSLGAAYTITLAAPGPDTVSANAEHLTFIMGTLTCMALPYAFMLALSTSMAHEVVIEVSRACFARGLVASRQPRLFTHALRRFLLAFTVGTLLVALVIGGKARVDAIREQTLAEQTARAALAASDLRAGKAPSQPGTLVVSTDELPPLLDLHEVEGSVSAFDPQRERAIAAASVDGQRWVLVEAEPPEQLLGFSVFLLSLTALLGLAAHIAASGIGRALTEPLGELSETTRQLVEVGELHGLRRTVPRHNDEISSLISNFNDMLDMFEELAGAAQTVARGDLRVTLDRHGVLHDAFRGMVTQLREIVTQLRATATDVASASTEIYASTQAHETSAQRQSEIVREVSERAASLALAAENIDAMAEGVLRDAEESLVTSDATVARTNELNSQTGEIAQLLGLIHEVADRSDLLALNGSLEATRAGDAGRGFSLVAAEMRRLAERVTGIVADVHEQISAVRQTSANTLTATEQSRELARSAADAARRISQVTRKQSEDTEQASAAAQAMAEVMVRSVGEVSQTRASAEGLNFQVAELERLTRRFEVGTPS